LFGFPALEEFLMFFFVFHRLEFLGDSFLKYAASLLVFLKNYQSDEGSLTEKRKEIIWNVHLTKIAQDTKVAEYLRIVPFAKRNDAILPLSPGQEFVACSSASATDGLKWSSSLRNTNIFLAKSDAKDIGDSEQQQQATPPSQYETISSVPEKALADMVESILGVPLANDCFTSKEKLSFQLLDQLEIVSQKDYELLMSCMNHHSTQNEFIDFLKPLCPPNHISTKTTEDCETSIHYTFKKKELLSLALTHSSSSSHWNYERLEFLGDAVLDYLVADFLFSETRKNADSQEDWDEGVLTELKRAFVNNGTLQEFSSSRLRLFAFLQADSMAITKLVDELHELSHNSEINVTEDTVAAIPDKTLDICQSLYNYSGTNKIGGLKVFADIFEGLLGAIFIDNQYQLKPVKEFLVQHGYFNVSFEQLCDLRKVFMARREIPSVK
jgi:dsRNA-specific ribonuclease